MIFAHNRLFFHIFIEEKQLNKRGRSVGTGFSRELDGELGCHGDTGEGEAAAGKHSAAVDNGMICALLLGSDGAFMVAFGREEDSLSW